MARDPENEDVEIAVWRDANGVWRCHVHIDNGLRQPLIETGRLELTSSDGLSLKVVALDALPRDTIHVEYMQISMPVEPV